ncbi:aldehyde dehydrogenase family protein [Rhodococcoides corynebacterioides]|uniref:aldehyde dehydrogenase family protein n=1 Tax=Rhodococcoides corynebacterioides TaxID=53972 RepID=UPI003ADD7737
MTVTTARPVVDLPEPLLRIGGRARAASDGRTFESHDPATGDHVASVAFATAADVDDAVRAARAQVDGGAWSRVPGAERGRLLLAVADLIDRECERLAALEAVEMGKLYRDSVTGDIPCAAAVFRHFAGWADKIAGTAAIVSDVGPQRRFGYTLRQPLGVVAAITPWNNPLLIAAWKVAPALAAGNTVVIKPAEDASLSTLLLADLVAEAGIPPGVVNVVTGIGDVTGAALAQHPGVDKVTFTGSPRVGATISALAGSTYRKIVLELGGKAPQLIFDDADLDAAMPWIAMGSFYHQGQVCAAGTRVLVHESVADRVVDGLAAAARASVIGDPFDERSTMGTIVNERQLARITGYIDAGVAEGADLVVGGHRVDAPGCYVEPTVFRGHNRLTIAQEEIFGPVATVIPFRTTEEAVALANDTRYGLNAMVYSENISRVQTVVEQLRVGTVWVNGWGVPDPALPWGGRGGSGVGRELGRSGLEGETEEKTVHIGYAGVAAADGAVL